MDIENPPRHADRHVGQHRRIQWWDTDRARLVVGYLLAGAIGLAIGLAVLFLMYLAVA